MKIVLSPSVSMNLEAVIHQVGKREFSGIGFCQIIHGDIHCYKILLLDVGSCGYSEIPSQRLIDALENSPDRDHVRLWFHRHPIEGWSTTDLDTITKAPLGGIPEIVGWSASIVRTPTHWIGRVDNHLHKTHEIVEVEPNIDPDLMVKARDRLADYWHRVAHEHPDDIAYLPDFPDLPNQLILHSSIVQIPNILENTDQVDREDTENVPEIGNGEGMPQDPDEESER